MILPQPEPEEAALHLCWMQPALLMHSWSHRSAVLEAGMQHGKGRQQLPLQLLVQYHSWYFTVSFASTRNSPSLCTEQIYLQDFSTGNEHRKTWCFCYTGTFILPTVNQHDCTLQWENSIYVHRKVILPQFLCSPVHFVVLLNLMLAALYRRVVA